MHPALELLRRIEAENTVFLERSPLQPVAQAMAQKGYLVGLGGWYWIEPQNHRLRTEQQAIAEFGTAAEALGSEIEQQKSKLSEAHRQLQLTWLQPGEATQEKADIYHQRIRSAALTGPLPVRGQA